MKVLHVTQPTFGGVAQAVVDIVEAQRSLGWEVAVANPPASQLADRLAAGQVRTLAWDAVRSPSRSIPCELKDLRRIIEEVDPDIVHLHSSKAGLVGRLALRSSRPTLFQPHGWSFYVPGRVEDAARRWEVFASRWTAAFVCVSTGEKANGLRAGITGRVEVLPNRVDTSTLRPSSPAERESARIRLGLPEGRLVICAGRFDYAKAQDVLVAAWAHVTAVLPEATLVFVGDGPSRAGLEARAGRNVIFVGSRDDVPSWFAAADVAVLPSRWEGLAYSMLEAMAVGLPVVTTDVPGARDALPERAIVPIESPIALAAALAERIADPELCAEEGRANRATVESRFAHSSLADDIVAVYDSL